MQSAKAKYKSRMHGFYTIFDFAVSIDFAVMPANSIDSLRRNFNASSWVVTNFEVIMSLIQ